jgi:hypothetical protein
MPKTIKIFAKYGDFVAEGDTIFFRRIIPHEHGDTEQRSSFLTLRTPAQAKALCEKLNTLTKKGESKL